MVGIYKSDFDKSGGFDMSLQGWGLEDVHLVANLVLREKVSRLSENLKPLSHIQRVFYRIKF